MPYAYLALLRAVNVGGKNILPMKDLAAMFLAAGCTDVKTFIQSGNVLFNAPPKVAKKIAVTLPLEIEKKFGHRPPFVIRTAKEMSVVASNNPFLKAGAPEEEVCVFFLAASPDAAKVKSLDPNRSPGDVYAVCGADVYGRLKTGFAKTKLTTAWFDSKLATVSTARNWRTVMTLTAMMSETNR